MTPELLLKKKWCFFSGSFNPWHLGHAACLYSLNQYLIAHPIDDLAVIILPDQNPQKKNAPHSPDYWQDFCSAFHKTFPQEVASLHFSYFLDDRFIQLNTANPTVHWISALHQQYPQNQLSLLMGLDSFLGLTSWVDYSHLLLQLHDLFVVPRKIAPEVSFSSKNLTSYGQQKKILTKIAPNLHIHDLPAHSYEDLSSTKIKLSLNVSSKSKER